MKVVEILCYFRTLYGRIVLNCDKSHFLHNTS